MKLFNETEFQLIEVMDGLENGHAIDVIYNGRHYEFYKENNIVLVRLDSETVGHLEQWEAGTYEELLFEDWNNEERFKIEWLGALDGYLFKYEF